MNRRSYLWIITCATFFSAPAAFSAGPPGGLDVNVVNAPDVIVINDESIPVPVTVQNPADVSLLEPIQFHAVVTVGAGTLSNGLTQAYVVPDKKRLVIEYISVEVQAVEDGDSLHADLVTTVGGTLVTHSLGVAEPIERAKIDPSGLNYRFLSRLVKLYADPNTNVSILASRSSRVGDTFVRFAVSGYW